MSVLCRGLSRSLREGGNNGSLWRLALSSALLFWLRDGGRRFIISRGGRSAFW